MDGSHIFQNAVCVPCLKIHRPIIIDLQKHDPRPSPILSTVFSHIRNLPSHRHDLYRKQQRVQQHLGHVPNPLLILFRKFRHAMVRELDLGQTLGRPALPHLVLSLVNDCPFELCDCHPVKYL